MRSRQNVILITSGPEIVLLWLWPSEGSLQRAPARRFVGQGHRSSLTFAQAIHTQSKKEMPLRSDLVFQATAQISNRFKLCKLATKATRTIHRPNTRLQDTINDVLIRCHESNPEAEVADEGSVVRPAQPVFSGV